MKATGWLKGLRVTADGTGIVSHAGVALVRARPDNTGLTAGLSKALASRRLLVHDRGRVLADLACAIADGAEVISDFRVIGDQADLFRLAASVPTSWRTLDEIARGGDRALGTITAAVNTARRRARAAAARHGALPSFQRSSYAMPICVPWARSRLSTCTISILGASSPRHRRVRIVMITPQGRPARQPLLSAAGYLNFAAYGSAVTPARRNRGADL